LILPNFLCVGAQKAGTTTLYNILKQHPDIYLPDVKELHYFDKDDNFKLGLEWYSKYFVNGYNNQKVIGEITPSYIFYEKVPERIYNTLGKDIKLIFILRDPVDRAYSHYLMSLKRQYETLPFLEALKLENNRICKGEFEKNHFSYISRGFYATQIKRYLRYFSKENMKIIIFERDFIENKRNTIKDILRFLQVDEIDLNINIHSNIANIPKIKIINSLIYKEYSFKKIINKIIPKNIRKDIIKLLNKLNQRPVKKDVKESIGEERKIIINKFFKKEILELEKILEIDLNIWFK